MSDEHKTGYTDDELRIRNGTRPPEIQRFVLRRAKNPIFVEDKVVWNFNNHTPNIESLEDRAETLRLDEYVIPYQISNIWAYMVSLFPQRLKDAEILRYQKSDGTYQPYSNYFRHSESEDNNRVRDEIDRYLNENDI